MILWVWYAKPTVVNHGILILQLPVTKPRREMDREPKRQSETEKRESPVESTSANPPIQPKTGNLLPSPASNGNSSSLLLQANKANKPANQTNGNNNNNPPKQPSGKILPAQANGNQGSSSVHTTITTFHTTPTPTDRKVVQVN